MNEPRPRGMILAAGLGSRLGDLSRHRPKPMLPVCGAPLVRWAGLWLAHHGVRDVVVNLHHLGGQIEAELGDGAALGLRIQYSREDGMILGTGGGLRKARGLLDTGDGAPIVVVNGKILVDLDLAAVVRAHRQSNAEATVVLRPDPNAERWGSLQLDRGGRVVRLLGDAPASDPGARPASAPLMFTGVHVFEPRFLERIPLEGQPCVVRTAYRDVFDEGAGLRGHVTEGYWWEHSTPARYLQGVRNVLEGAVCLPYAEHPTRGVHPTASIHPTARVRGPVWIGPGVRVESGARVGPFVQLGAGVVVEAGAAVASAVAWPGARLYGEVTHQVRVGSGGAG